MAGRKRGVAVPKDDRQVVEGAFGDVASLDVIHLGSIQFAVWDELRQLYENKGTPLTSDECAAVVKKHSRRRDPSTILNELENKHVIQSDESLTKNRPRIPRTKGVRIMLGRSSTPKQVWPSHAKLAESKTHEHEFASDQKIVQSVLERKDGALICVDDSLVLQLSSRRAKVYEAFMEISRNQGYAPLTPRQARALLEKRRESTNVLHAFDHRFGITVHVGPIVRGTQVNRKIVFAPYRVRGEGVVHTPPECVVQTQDVVPQPDSSERRTSLRSKNELTSELESARKAVSERRAELEATRQQAHAAMLDRALEEIQRLREQVQVAQERYDELAAECEQLEDQQIADEELSSHKQLVADLEFAIDNYDAVMRFANRTS